ncbi:MAG TPA: acyl-CoA carboxylase subunit epsilon [Acidimicrobiia bacterium]|nr:acyl-CoA carboxylase subunit epsilon [Acidimicrobiia bacterium]
MTPEEVAAVTAVTVALQQREAAATAAATAAADGPEPLSAWVDASRRSAQNALMQRGPWRLSSRIGRRSRT